jgi:hypothetical protein
MNDNVIMKRRKLPGRSVRAIAKAQRRTNRIDYQGWRLSRVASCPRGQGCDHQHPNCVQRRL